MEAELLAMYADPALDRSRRCSSSAAARTTPRRPSQLVAALLRRPGGDVQVVNVRNDGTLPFLPDDAVIEVPATVDCHGRAARCRSRRSSRCTPGSSPHVTAYEHLALDAALHGGRERVFEALLAHPLVGQVDLADGLTDRLIAHNREHLPWA